MKKWPWKSSWKASTNNSALIIWDARSFLATKKAKEELNWQTFQTNCSEMVVDKLRHPCTDWFPYKPRFHYIIWSALMLYFFPQKLTTKYPMVSTIVQPKQEMPLFSWSLTPNGRTGIMVETLHCKRSPLMEEAKKVKTESDRNQVKTRVNREAFTWWRVPVLCQGLFPSYGFSFALDSSQAASRAMLLMLSFWQWCQP